MLNWWYARNDSGGSFNVIQVMMIQVDSFQSIQVNNGIDYQ